MVYVLKTQAQDPKFDWSVVSFCTCLSKDLLFAEKEEGSPGPSLFWNGTRSAPEMISYSKPLLMALKFCPIAKCNVDLDWYGQHSKKESFSTSFRKSRLYISEIILPGIYLRSENSVHTKSVHKCFKMFLFESKQWKKQNV